MLCSNFSSLSLLIICLCFCLSLSLTLSVYRSSSLSLSDWLFLSLYLYQSLYKTMHRMYYALLRLCLSSSFTNSVCTVCPRSSDPFYAVGYFMNWGTISWIHSIPISLSSFHKKIENYRPLQQNTQITLHL